MITTWHSVNALIAVASGPDRGIGLDVGWPVSSDEQGMCGTQSDGMSNGHVYMSSSIQGMVGTHDSSCVAH